MKLLSVNLARSIWLCSFNELNPKGKNLYLGIPALVNLYKFRKFPSQTELLDGSKGIKFEDGEFKNSEGEAILVTLTLYNDGLVADTRSSTQDSDNFLIEISTQLSEAFNLPRIEQVMRKKDYLSQLFVTTDISLDLINPKLKETSKYLSDNLSGLFEIGGISFYSDPATRPNPSQFTLERVLNVPFIEKKYYSSANLQTEKHLQCLEELENILSIFPT
jgi:hypothetical protein